VKEEVANSDEEFETKRSLAAAAFKQAADEGTQPENLMKRAKGRSHDQADAEWIVTRGPIRGHNDTPFGQPTPSWPIGYLGLANLRAYLVFSVTIN
jgi:hypothetical protein